MFHYIFLEVYTFYTKILILYGVKHNIEATMPMRDLWDFEFSEQMDGIIIKNWFYQVIKTELFPVFVIFPICYGQKVSETLRFLRSTYKSGQKVCKYENVILEYFFQSLLFNLIFSFSRVILDT